ncbi:hypothetical protein C8035_v006913 [Colletotrichum spinosum]|uniref:Uncharacterized protein n=1 Tax=Colletotrichum spinosum TaxID=1347390 RepID=A0A4R8QL50_9PEZI|nr:hypothetical protein C8035_v006913 [Colletotrichum spinosum]
MAPAKRLEYPILRSRKRFSNHEAMSGHLYTCAELCSGEYWCYDCGKTEKFTDAKCKSHLGKRQRIMAVAKNPPSWTGRISTNIEAHDLFVNNTLRSSAEGVHVLGTEVDSTEILEIDPIEVHVSAAPSTFTSSKDVGPTTTGAFHTQSMKAETATSPLYCC